MAVEQPHILNMVNMTLAQIDKEISGNSLYDQYLQIDDESLKAKALELLKVWFKKYKARLHVEVENIMDKENDENRFEKEGWQYQPEFEDKVGQMTLEDMAKRRVEVMNSTNPKYILRNYLAEKAIMAAEEGNYVIVK